MPITQIESSVDIFRHFLLWGSRRHNALMVSITINPPVALLTNSSRQSGAWRRLLQKSSHFRKEQEMGDSQDTSPKSQTRIFGRSGRTRPIHTSGGQFLYLSLGRPATTMPAFSLSQILALDTHDILIWKRSLGFS